MFLWAPGHNSKPVFLRNGDLSILWHTLNRTFLFKSMSWDWFIHGHKGLSFEPSRLLLSSISPSHRCKALFWRNSKQTEILSEIFFSKTRRSWRIVVKHGKRLETRPKLKRALKLWESVYLLLQIYNNGELWKDIYLAAHCHFCVEHKN